MQSTTQGMLRAVCRRPSLLYTTVAHRKAMVKQGTRVVRGTKKENLLCRPYSRANCLCGERLKLIFNPIARLAFK